MGVKIHYDNKEKFYDFAPIPAPEMDGENGVPIEVSMLPEPTEDILGKVYFNTTDGEYYVCSEDRDFKVGQPLGDKIYFDTTIYPIEERYLRRGSQDDDGVQLHAVSSDGKYEFILGYIYSSDLSAIIAMYSDVENEPLMPISMIFVHSNTYTVEEINTQFPSDMAISNFGWQIDVLDTSEYADFIIIENSFPENGHRIHACGKKVFKKINKFDSIIEGSITKISSDKITSIGDSAFYSQYSLTSADFPNATSIGARAFYDCVLLTSADFPNTTSIGDSAFKFCYSLTSADFPNVTSIGEYAFSGCYSLTSADFPNATSTGEDAFYECYSLTSADFPNATSIDDTAFFRCYSLTKLILGVNQATVATLVNTNAFLSCYHIEGTTDETYNPDGIKDGYIYVPATLVADYRVAENWSTYASQIMPYVATLDELTNIDGTTYDKACVGTDYTEYTFNGTEWEVYR